MPSYRSEKISRVEIGCRVPDTSPSYLLFQTLLPLFWTLTCMIWMELTRTDVVSSRIAMVLFFAEIKVLGMTWNFTENIFGINKNTGERINTRGATPCPRGWRARPPPWGVPPASWAPWGSTDVNSNSIYSRSGRKKSERRIRRVLWYGAAAKP